MSSVFTNKTGMQALISAIYEQAADDLLQGCRMQRTREQDIKLPKTIVPPCQECKEKQENCRPTCERYADHRKNVAQYKKDRAAELRIRGTALVRECEKFFRDDPYMQLSDPERIIRELKRRGRFRKYELRRL